MTVAVKGLDRTNWRNLRIVIVATLIALTVQGWTGDVTNLFSMFPSGGVEQSLNGIFKRGRDDRLLDLARFRRHRHIRSIAGRPCVFHQGQTKEHPNLCGSWTSLRGGGRVWGTILCLVRVYEQWKLCPDGRQLHRRLRILFHRTLLRKVAQ